MSTPPSDLDRARAGISAADLVAMASNHLTQDLYFHLEFSDLVAVKTLLKRFFSAQPWTDEDTERLDLLLSRNVADHTDWYEHDLGGGFRLMHGFRDDAYRLWVTGGSESEASIFDRVFAGPVQPEATPNPRHVRFVLGGEPSPGIWYRPDDELDDPRVAELLGDDDVTDVLVAGDFVAIGLRRSQMWRDRLDDLVAKVTELYWSPGRETTVADTPTRDDLVAGPSGGEELHLLNPDDPTSRATLETARAESDPRIRRMAIAILAQSSDLDYALAILAESYTDDSRIVRRTVVDSAVDIEDDGARVLLEQALCDEDAWIRWKAVKGIFDLGIGPSREQVETLADDTDFRVRFEVAAALHAEPG